MLALGAFPIGVARGLVERRLSAALKAKVRIGAVTRDGVFSFTPLVSVRDLRIAQPAWAQPPWAGQDDFVRVRAAALRIAGVRAAVRHLPARSRNDRWRMGPAPPAMNCARAVADALR